MSKLHFNVLKIWILRGENPGPFVCCCALEYAVIIWKIRHKERRSKSMNFAAVIESIKRSFHLKTAWKKSSVQKYWQLLIFYACFFNAWVTFSLDFDIFTHNVPFCDVTVAHLKLLINDFFFFFFSNGKQIETCFKGSTVLLFNNIVKRKFCSWFKNKNWYMYILTLNFIFN